MIWPILARYMIALSMGATWHDGPLMVKALWAVILASLVMRDTRDALRRDRAAEPRTSPTQARLKDAATQGDSA